MRRITFFVLMVLGVVVAMACSKDGEEIDGVTGATEQNGDDNGGTATGKKSLVVFFSRAGENYSVGYVERGNTAIMVDYIRQYADVDVYEIVPSTPYPDGYEDCKTVATAEFNNGTRPAYKNDITSIADYDNVFIGGPIWWARPPMIFRTFFEAHPELAEKTLIPFGTHGGSGVGSYKTLLQEYFPSTTILESLGISGSSIRNASSASTVESWLKRIGLDKAATGVSAAKASKAETGVRYTLNGNRYTGGSGIVIENGKKRINR